ncbi:hypothetical protein Dsin_014046 [Dipteronia sinensis]|uniref:RNase H type-1 domain-containing protein n=1 Tax=Dipteronia sinensis TaxID=43782 RepID=A0AAE0AKZ9_9ROSI|nr:hypothetical protein Dsin_014046 [Dipteronia sinensis]
MVDKDSVLKSVWQGICPPKIELVVWQLLRGKGRQRGSPSPTGVGGVLRDSNGKVICLFSAFLGTYDSNTAEIMAIRKACELCVSRSDLADRRVKIVSDSKVAVSWVYNEDFGIVKHVRIIYEIQSVLSLLKNMEVIHNSRATNSFADMLAKKKDQATEGTL